AGDKQRSWANHRLTGGSLASDGLLFLAIARNRFDDSRFGIHFSNPMIGDVGDVNVVLRIERDAVRRAELCLCRRAAVAAKTSFAVADDRADLAAFDIHLADEMIFHLDETNVAGRVEADFVWLVELGFCGWTAIARIALCAIAGDNGQLVLAVQFPEPVV